MAYSSRTSHCLWDKTFHMTCRAYWPEKCLLQPHREAGPLVSVFHHSHFPSLPLAHYTLSFVYVFPPSQMVSSYNLFLTNILYSYRLDLKLITTYSRMSSKILIRFLFFMPLNSILYIHLEYFFNLSHPIRT